MASPNNTTVHVPITRNPVTSNLITMGKKYQTRDGRAVRILATNLKLRDYPIIGAITERDGSEEPCEWMADGCALDTVNGDCSLDLVPALTKHEGWAVMSDIARRACFTSRREAKEFALMRGDKVALVIWEE